MKRTLLSALVLSTVLSLGAPAAFSAQQQPQQPDVQVVNLQVVQNQDGSQSVITPKGDLAFLPGGGVNGGVAQIYFGQQGGFWYVDRTGKTIDLNPTVQALQARRANAPQVAPQIPQYAPVPPDQYADYGDTAQEDDGDDEGGRKHRVGNAVSTAVTAGAAAAGAAAGTAMTNRYYNAPYGTPMYYGNNGYPYYYDHGDRRELDDINLNQNQKVAIHNKRTIEKQNKQKAAQSVASSRNGANNFQAQQNWYSQERQSNPQRFEQVASNPFTSDGGSRRSGGGREARSSSRGGGGGRGGARGGGGRRR